MKQIIYRIIYHHCVNAWLRNLNKLLRPILPAQLKLPPSGVLKLRNKDGKVLKLKTNQTNYLSQKIFWEGYENFEYTGIFIRLVKKMKTFYDVGANIGYYSLLASMENAAIRVVGFEPAGGPLFYFKENVRLNKYQNITIEPLALSNQEGEITFYEIKNKKYTYLKHSLSGESNTGGVGSEKKHIAISVKTTTLDRYVADQSEKHIDLIKLDTEGTEHFILEKSQAVLSIMKPIVICETLFQTIEPELEIVFKSAGYEFYNHTENGLKKTESIIRIKDDGVRNCFFVHPSKRHLIEEFVC